MCLGLALDASRRHAIPGMLAWQSLRALRRIQDIQWSTPSVLQQSLDQAHAMGWSCAPVTSLPACQDLDTIRVRVLLLHCMKACVTLFPFRECSEYVRRDLLSNPSVESPCLYSCCLSGCCVHTLSSMLP